MQTIENVYTKDELKAAVDRKSAHIIVHGELAEKLNTALKITNVSKWTLGLLVAALSVAPFTGGLSLAAAAPIAVLTGIEIVAIVAVAFLGVALVLSIGRDFKKVGFKAKHAGSEASFEMKSKSKTKTESS